MVQRYSGTGMVPRVECINAVNNTLDHISKVDLTDDDFKARRPVFYFLGLKMAARPALLD